MSTAAYYYLRKSASGRRAVVASSGAHALITSAPQPEGPPPAEGEVRTVAVTALQPGASAAQRRRVIVKTA
ncbi:hypothetical protein [Chromobacterium sp. IIBBL 290-4]|uniref:hypothetical protein n=1 Tax=Chromobacterium sp. IIBBL 290-4 TaxID=2953890 RepID=UPI0020B6A8F0|nr:hypothetical protein [Chromobacterium sp. IIBBL 290-4]UTH73532.1 hypothetical protein NKT35_18625 [Chromobacterium sp. IIBBL 290-4]